jgi:hypothetical protein
MFSVTLLVNGFNEHLFGELSLEYKPKGNVFAAPWPVKAGLLLYIILSPLNTNM